MDNIDGLLLTAEPAAAAEALKEIFRGGSAQGQSSSGFCLSVGQAYARTRSAKGGLELSELMARLNLSRLDACAFALSVFSTTADLEGDRKVSKDLLRKGLRALAVSLSQETSSSSSSGSSSSSSSIISNDGDGSVLLTLAQAVSADELSGTSEGREFIAALSTHSGFLALTTTGIGKRSLGYLDLDEEFDFEASKAAVISAAGSSPPAPSLADLLSAEGSGCSESEDSFRAALQKHTGGGEGSSVSLDEAQLASLMMALTTRWSSSESGWNDRVISAVLRKDTRSLSLNWPKVARAFDSASSDLDSLTSAEFLKLLKNYRFLAGSTFPVTALLGDRGGGVWSNATAQLSMLYWAAHCTEHTSFVDFSQLTSAQPSLADVPPPTSPAWTSLSFYTTLLSLANTGSGLAGCVSSVLRQAAELRPEYTLLVLARVDPQSLPALSQLIRTDVVTSVLVILGSRSPPASAPTVMRALLNVNSTLLALLLRVAFKQCKSLHEVAKLCNVFKNSGRPAVDVLKRVEEEGAVEEVLSYWCYKADTDPSFNLDAHVRRVFDQRDTAAVPAAAKEIVSFLRQQGPARIPLAAPSSKGKSVESLPLGSNLLTHDSLAALLRGLGCCKPEDLDADDTKLVAELTGQQAAAEAASPEAFGVSPSEKAYRLYSNVAEPEEKLVASLLAMQSSNDEAQQLVSAAVVRLVMEEAKFVHKCATDRELVRIARLLGHLVLSKDLLPGKPLGLALRYVLEALRKNPDNGGAQQVVFRFGLEALKAFAPRLASLPQLCWLLKAVPHLEKHLPSEVFAEVIKHAKSPSAGAGGGDDGNVLSSESGAGGEGGGAGDGNGEGKGGGGGSSSSASNASSSSSSSSLTHASHASIIKRMVAVNVDVTIETTPPEALSSQVQFHVNNISKNNVEHKCVELQKLLKPEYFGWFASFLVMKRISTQPNYHALYMTMLDILDEPKLNKEVLNSTFFHITQLLQSPTIYTTSSSERSLLRNLGIWLGQATLARNKPLLQRRIDLKELIFWAYETGKLIAICSFIVKIVEGCRDSVVFRPPNPWLMTVLGVLRDIYEVEDLKMNIKFEVQVLCKNVNIRIEEIPRLYSLTNLATPAKDGRNPDFNALKTAATPSGAAASGGRGSGAAGAGASGAVPLPAGATAFTTAPTSTASAGTQDRPLIPNIESYVVISPKLTFFTNAPQHRIIVSRAVSFAIREIILSILEKIVPISCNTTKLVILKDFCTEPNEQTLRDAAHLMATSLVSNLSVVTSKELLRMGMAQHLRLLLSKVTNDSAVIEEIVHTCCEDNINLGCAVIEKASIEKATRDVDEGLAFAYLARKKAREKNLPFVDAPVMQASQQTLNLLPEEMRPVPGGLQPPQLAVYEAYQRLRYQAVSVPKPSPAAPAAPGSGPSGGSSGPASKPELSAPPSTAGGELSMVQALEGFRIVFERLDMSLQQVRVQSQGRELTVSMLGPDHDVMARFRELIAITTRTQTNARVDAVMTFSENIFKRIFDHANGLDALGLEVLVGSLEALRNASRSNDRLLGEVGGWLSRHGNINIDDESNRKNNFSALVLLLRTQIVRPGDMDGYFVLKISSSMGNMLWVEFSLTFIRRCMIDGLAFSYDFPNTFLAINSLRPSSPLVVKQLQKWLSDLQALAVSKSEPPKPVVAAGGNAPALHNLRVAGPGGAGPAGQGGNMHGQGPIGALPLAPPLAPLPQSVQVQPRDPRHAVVREQVANLLDRWLRIWANVNEQSFTQYLQLMHQFGILATEEAADLFFRVATELCAEACLKTAVAGGSGDAQTTLTFTVVDALSKLFLLLMRIADKEAGDTTVRVNLLTRLLTSIGRALLEDHENKKASKLVFDQRPYCRLLSNLMQDLGKVDPASGQEPSVTYLPLLTVYGQILFELRPAVAPGFAFGWLDLLSSPHFMTQLLLLKGKRGWPMVQRLLCSLLQFMQPFLKTGQLNDAIRKLYKGVLRVMVALYQEFPEFLADNYLPFCEVVPSNCVPLRNLACAAAPRGVAMVSPFSPNFSWDKPELSLVPAVNVDFNSALNAGVLMAVDSYLDTRMPHELPMVLPQALKAAESGPGYVTAINALVVYVGMRDCIAVCVDRRVPLAQCPALEIYRQLLRALDVEGRFLVLHAMVDSLRFPNAHTHFFTGVLQVLFLEPDAGLSLQEQIARILLERLVASLPHPWGVIHTFVELVQNHSLLTKPFAQGVPEIERVYRSLVSGGGNMG